MNNSWPMLNTSRCRKFQRCGSCIHPLVSACQLVSLHDILGPQSRQNHSWMARTPLNWSPIKSHVSVDIECLCTLVVLMDAFFSDYFSSFLSWFITWFVACVFLCFSLFALFVDMKFSCPESFLFSLWHWVQECSIVVYLNSKDLSPYTKSTGYSVAQLVFKGLVLGPMKDWGLDWDWTNLGLDCSPGPTQGPAKCGPSPGRLVLGPRTDAGPVWTSPFWA